MKNSMLLRLCAALILCACCLSSCEARSVGWGSQHIDDPLEYGSFGIIDAPEYFPDSIDGYTVNAYSYTIEAWMDVCHEIFVDLTVTEDQLTELLTPARAHGGYIEQAAYYADGYCEIVYSDYYEICTSDDGEKNVGYATIDKIIYSTDMLNIIYVQLHAHDTGVYRLSDVKYFERFGIDEAEYVSHTKRQ